ncbi:hypothetical protein cypCar_00034522 [Cyprinus carpio]|nr:hypothetical protein cypCar_00034522 [Cyprinus carpio]
MASLTRFQQKSRTRDSQRDDFLKDLENITMGICVIKKEGAILGDYNDIGIIVVGVMIVAQACALMLGTNFK